MLPLANPDLNEPFEIAPGIWWVGHYLPDDSFQCHVYLIDQGDQSVLVDPGSFLTFPHSLVKIQKIMPFTQIKTLVCQHQDPDITSALLLIQEMEHHPDLRVVTSWRAATLLKHYDLSIPMLHIENLDWKLVLPTRSLQFILTPYLHFPGAFCTYDSQSQTLFTSDLFGAFTEDWHLYAQNEDYFEAMRPFHEHYMPSREFLVHGLTKLERFPLKLLAPQHGSLIQPPLIEYFFQKLKALDCGLFLMEDEIKDIRYLAHLNQTLKEILQSIVVYRDFNDIAQHLLSHVQRVLPVVDIQFFIPLDKKACLHLSPTTRFKGDIVDCSPQLLTMIAAASGPEKISGEVVPLNQATGTGEGWCLVLPLYPSNQDQLVGLALFGLEKEIVLSEEIHELLSKFALPLGVAVERESIYRSLELERDRIYNMSIRDPLTSLYTRYYMRDAAPRMLHLHDRDPSLGVILVALDLDYFKAVNDQHGHVTGDQVLRRLGELFMQQCRMSDIPVRFGGEEFLVFIPTGDLATGVGFVQRMQAEIAKVSFLGKDGQEFKVTLSFGIALHQPGEALTDFIRRADQLLYQAKHRGRNGWVCQDEDQNSSLSAKKD